MQSRAAPDREPVWPHSLGEEVANSISHGLGLVASAVGASILLFTAWRAGDRLEFIGATVFATAMLLVYACSVLYHAWPRGRLKLALRVIDHSAIFLLIAATYTPFALGPLRGAWGWSVLTIIWLLAVGGVALKYFAGADERPKTSLALYLGMGWLAVFVLRPLVSHVPAETLCWLIAGGVAYTSGVLFFVREGRPYTHFIWHLFVLVGTACHFLAVFTCISL